jgi:uncharacterized membrane protein YhaH (DUF805 family)
MKYLPVIIILIIGIFAIIGTGLMYGWIFIIASFPIWILVVFGLGILGLIIAFIGVGVQRMRELGKEDQNDLSKY